MNSNHHQPAGPNSGLDGPDEAFLEEVDAFLGSLPEDSPRVKRIWRKLPQSFHQVLAQKGYLSEPEVEPEFRLNWALISGAIAVAAALLAMVFVAGLGGQEDDGPKTNRVAQPSSGGAGEPEIEIVFAPEGDSSAPRERLVPDPSRRDSELVPAVVGHTPPTPPEPEMLDPLEHDKLQPPVIPSADPALPWSFNRLVAADLPILDDESWPRSDIDRFTLFEMELVNVKPVADADPAALIRRLSYDLTGLPPSPELVERFLHNPSPAAYGSVVDELMAKWQFGEHWARHWLDVAGYDAGVSNAWRYREYVIAAFNSDKPYDRFLAEQIAGDLLPVADIDQRAEGRIATGFLAMGAYDPDEDDVEQFVMDRVDKQVDLVSTAFMGLSVSCARCHDHKFDPIPQRDFFALAGIFRSTQLFNGFRHKEDEESRPETLLPLRLAQQTRTSGNLLDELRHKSELKRLRLLVASSGKRVARAKGRGDERRIARLEREAMQLKRQLHKVESLDPKRLKTLGFTSIGVAEKKQPVDCQLNLRGDVNKLGPTVPRGFLSALGKALDAPEIPEGRSGRVELAGWLTDKKHPLTSRVFVNRVWHHLFGRGLVASVDDFGMQSEMPSHPELLDYLAVQFVEGGWSTKQLIRNMVMSRTYQLASSADSHNLVVDPDNRLLWRHSLRPLSGEELRDSMIAIAGVITEGSSAVEVEKRFFAAGEYGAVSTFQDASEFPLSSSFRTIYLPIKDKNPGMLALFDCPEPAARSGARSVTTTPTQALFMMNNEFVYQASMGASFPLVSMRHDRGMAQKIEDVFLATLGRKPNSEELRGAARFVSDFNAVADLGISDEGNELVASAFAPGAMLEKLVPSIVLQDRASATDLDSMAQAAPWTMLFHGLMETAEFRLLR